MLKYTIIKTMEAPSIRHLAQEIKIITKTKENILVTKNLIFTHSLCHFKIETTKAITLKELIEVRISIILILIQINKEIWINNSNHFNFMKKNPQETIITIDDFHFLYFPTKLYIYYIKVNQHHFLPRFSFQFFIKVFPESPNDSILCFISILHFSQTS